MGLAPDAHTRLETNHVRAIDTELALICSDDFLTSDAVGG